MTIALATITSAVTGSPLATAGHASCGGNLDETTLEADAEKHVKIAFAGTMAERELLPDVEPGLWGGDWAIATSLAVRLWPSDVNARLVLLATEAAQDVRDMRREIERVADALLERETLNGAEIKEVLAA